MISLSLFLIFFSPSGTSTTANDLEKPIVHLDEVPVRFGACLHEEECDQTEVDKANVRANFKDVKLPTDPRLEVTRSDIVKLGEGHFRFDQMYRFEENGVYNSMVLTGNPSFNESDEAIEIDLSNEITGLYEEDGSSASLRWKDPDTGFTYSVAGFKNVDSESSRMTKEEMLSIYDSYEPITDNEKPAS